MRSFSTSCFLLLILLISSCGGDKPTPKDANEATAASEATDFPEDTLKDSYIGKLNDKAMTLRLFYVGDGHVTGYNIVSGNRRNVSGTYTIDNDGVKMTLSEPGDDKYDGVFNLAMSRNDLSVISGEWTSKSGEVKTVWTKRINDNESGLKGDYTGKYLPPFVDSVLTVRFEEDGSCSYEYYENEGEIEERFISIDGSYESNGKTVVINWIRTDMLPKKSVFNIVRNEIVYQDEEGTTYHHTLQGMGRTLDERYYD